MNRDPDFDAASETSRLLSELDKAIDHSGALRAIVRRRELLYELERLTGPSRRTRSLRREIHLMEQRLRAERDAGDTGTSFSPA